MAYIQKNNPFKKNSPNKFLGGLVGKAMGGLGKAALGGIGNLLGGSRLFGGSRRGNATANNDMSNVNSMTEGPMMNTPLTKKQKYKK